MASMGMIVRSVPGAQRAAGSTHRHPRLSIHSSMSCTSSRWHHSWRAWARQRRQKAARQRAALGVYHRRLLGAALRQWRWVQHGKALLRRVFGTAAELWREEVGARLHQRNHELLLACWDGWQLAVLQAQARRRQAMLDNAAAAFRCGWSRAAAQGMPARLRGMLCVDWLVSSAAQTSLGHRRLSQGEAAAGCGAAGLPPGGGRRPAGAPPALAVRPAARGVAAPGGDLW